MQEAAPTDVLVTVGVSDASPPAVIRVRREALISARRTVEAGVACGGIRVQTSDPVALLVTALEEAKRACAIITTRW